MHTSLPVNLHVFISGIFPSYPILRLPKYCWASLTNSSWFTPVTKKNRIDQETTSTAQEKNIHLNNGSFSKDIFINPFSSLSNLIMSMMTQYKIGYINYHYEIKMIYYHFILTKDKNSLHKKCYCSLRFLGQAAYKKKNKNKNKNKNNNFIFW